ncbi:MAG: hypothetical protein M3Z23_07050 [Acidobacteriota bacterium]|nr:hypothetical protein [Acidobacteriota bacterium]
MTIPFPLARNAPPVQLLDVRLREACFSDHAAIAALEAAQGLKPKALAEWRALWEGNPCYREIGPSWPIGWVIETSDGKIAGSLCNLPLPYVYRGQKLLIATGRGWAVDERYRSYALLLMDAYLSQSRVDLFLNTTVNGSAAAAFGVFGSARVPVGDWGSAAFFITRYRGFAESALRIKQSSQPHLLSYPVGLALYVKERFTAKRISATEIPVEFSRDFDERFDPFWEALSRDRQKLLAVRDRAVLRWHFSASLARQELWVLTVSRNAAIQACAIFQRRDEPQFGLKRMRMVDFQALHSRAEFSAAILRRALEQCRAQGIHALENVGCGLENTRVFDQFAPYRRKLSAWSCFYLSRRPELAESLRNPSAWAPSSYDGDSSV